jgi:hypothetical protein
MDDRERLLKQDGYLIGIATASLLCGMHFSPWFDLFAGPIAAIMTGFFITSPLLLFYFASLVVSVGAVMIAGIPAAIYERNTGKTQSDATSLAIWFGATVVLALPALANLFGGR